MPSKYTKPIILSSSGSAANTQGNLMGLLLTATTAGAAVVSDSPTDANAPIFSVNVPSNDSVFLDFSNLGGVPFSNGLYVSLGSTMKAHIWIE